MADERSLMRPLNSDSLKARPSTQAVWNPPVPAQPPVKEPLDLDAAIAAILSEEEAVDDDCSAAQDAMPTEKMPEPVCVPLYEEPAPVRRRRGWLWLLAALLLAGGLYAAWSSGLLPPNWA